MSGGGSPLVLGLRQEFAQAWREMAGLTDAERAVRRWRRGGGNARQRRKRRRMWARRDAALAADLAEVRWRGPPLPERIDATGAG